MVLRHFLNIKPNKMATTVEIHNSVINYMINKRGDSGGNFRHASVLIPKYGMSCEKDPKVRRKQL